MRGSCCSTETRHIRGEKFLALECFNIAVLAATMPQLKRQTLIRTWRVKDLRVFRMRMKGQEHFASDSALLAVLGSLRQKTREKEETNRILLQQRTLITRAKPTRPSTCLAHGPRPTEPLKRRETREG